ncbi:SGNH hydrolase domain-containing protein [Marinagarivorans cellulosilyticus]|uniref:SGNH hydrolase domain-containing protein n=1 Tax=Marinagarivorans cellulosilyticus TaxID=2721545 RepID=UPI00308405E1
METPFRNRKKYNRRAIFSYSIVALSFFGALGLTGSYFKGYENRFSAPTYPATTLYSPKRNGCHTSGANYLKPDKSCQYQNGNLKWAVFGDSHIVEPAYALSQQLESKGESLLHLSFSGCPPVLLYDGGRIGCTEWFRESLSHIQNKKEIENVLIGFRYTPFIYDAEHYIRKHPELFPEGNIDPREIYWKSLHEVIKRLQLSGKKVFVLFPIPELPVDIEKITTPFSIFHKQYTYDLANTIPIDEYEATNAFILDKLNQLPWSENLIAVKTIDSLCGDYYCPAIKNEKPLFFDSNHLSIYGGEIIAKSIMNLQ